MRKSIKNYLNNLEAILKWIAYLSPIIPVVGLISKIFSWGSKQPFLFISKNIIIFWLISLSALSFVLLIWLIRLHRRFIYGFRDKFKKPLNYNWDFDAQWRVSDENTLIVTGSDSGGLTKTGALWENYSFSFKANIIKDCLGVIARAVDLNNYYMFQIRNDKIRPHRRVAVPIIVPKSQNSDDSSLPSNNYSTIQSVSYTVGWQIFEDQTVNLDPPLEGWFKVVITVRGESVSILINDILVFQAESFLKIPRGKVGFRNIPAEIAEVKNVKVELHP